MNVTCPTCGASNVFDQPYAYHAGFSEQAFLYNDAGDCTLTWSVHDPLFEALLAKHSPESPWALTPAAQQELERRLPRSPRGDRWRFANAPRCRQCLSALAPPMGPLGLTYFLYPGSVELGLTPNKRTLEGYMSGAPAG